MNLEKKSLKKKFIIKNPKWMKRKKVPTHHNAQDQKVSHLELSQDEGRKNENGYQSDMTRTQKKKLKSMEVLE